jgi:hypothetical protein
MNWTRLIGETRAGVAPVALATGSTTGSASAKELKLEMILLGQAASDRTRTTVLEQLRDQANQQLAEKSFAIRPNERESMAQVLNAGRPKPQVRQPQDREAAVIAELLLGSPEFQRR